MPTPSKPGLRVVVGFAVALGMVLGGCAFPGSGSRVSASPTKTYRVPTQADLTGMEQKVMALGHVTGAHLTFRKGVFGGSNDAYMGEITSDATDQATLNSILDGTYRIIWTTPGVKIAVLYPAVTNPTTGKGAYATDLGLDMAPGFSELELRYGPRP
jgi:hypothetical protein